MTIKEVLGDIRSASATTADKGARFERLILNYFLTEPNFANQLDHAWLWSDFPCRAAFGGHDIGVDVVCRTKTDEYWAIQCKCYDAGTMIDKSAVDSFIATSAKSFSDGLITKRFTRRYWVDSLPNALNRNAQLAMANQHPTVHRIGLHDLDGSSVDWEKVYKGQNGAEALQPRKTLRDDQREAIRAAKEHFCTADRGKMIMACGTGKTFTSLRLAEEMTGGKGTILFLVPSISLLSQTLMAWTADADEPVSPICVCSDEKVSAKKTVDDVGMVTVEQLAEPATTDAERIRQLVAVKRKVNPDGMLVVFSTYQSIEAVAAAQKAVGKDLDFDLIICDEAHRTTGVTLEGEEESAFVRVHDAAFIRGAKRLYMTATPRLYKTEDQDKAKDKNACLCSMDDESLYGKEFYRMSFAEAVKQGLLCDYKVVVLTMNRKRQGKLPAGGDVSEHPDDWQKLAGTAAALSKISLTDDTTLYRDDPQPMRKAVAFCTNIKASNKIRNTFNRLNRDYADHLAVAPDGRRYVQIESDHVDGGMNAQERNTRIAWLKDTPADADDCRVLCNVRCLSEGVDVPSLDAAVFLSPRKSQVEIVQSVGRVMRKSPGKKFGYLVIPVIVDPAKEAEKALEKNKDFQIVWSVACALRSHDERFNLYVNNPDMDGRKSSPGGGGRGPLILDGEKFDFPQDELETAFYARMVQKVGDRRYWVQWAQDIAEIANRHIAQITEKVAADRRARAAFDRFLKGLHKNINPSITEQAAVEMLAQHIITKPVFEALFDGSDFIANNPISKSLQHVLDILDIRAANREEAETLARFYESVKDRASGVRTAEGRQKIIVELYDSFFKNAFPKMVEQLGIVYTPVEVVDFIIHSVAHVLKKEFGRDLSGENVNIIDPFTGTGTFIVRLLQSGLIKPEDLKRKYEHELRANEIVLLAYYIASVNIENAYHSIARENLFVLEGRAPARPMSYTPFGGICLTDTFQLAEDTRDLFSDIFPVNSKRVQEQVDTPIHVVIGNPPYSVGQKSANDNAANLHYPKLEARLEATYARNSTATNKNSLYDSYIKAFRWATDRLDPKCGGVIGFVTNGSWLDGNAQDGFRKSIEQEFDAVYVFNLRGNCRTSGELRRKESGNVFGEGSRTPVTITILVKKGKMETQRRRDTEGGTVNWESDFSNRGQKARIYYRDIGDYLSRAEKLKIIRETQSIEKLELTQLQPNEHGDWLNQRNDVFAGYLPIGDKEDKKNDKTFFVPYYSNGLKTQRDTWCYNSSQNSLENNIRTSIEFYNEQCECLRSKQISEVHYDSTKFSWTRAALSDVAKGKQYNFDDGQLRTGMYRPFFKQYLFFYRPLNEMVYQIPKLFPSPQTDNLVICVSGVGVTKDFSCIITDTLPDLELIGKSQCFPLYYYEERADVQPTLFDATLNEERYIRHDGVTDWILREARKAYGQRVTKEDIFYYVYGFLHSKDYRTTFAADLKKMLPRLPLVETREDFWAFSKAGRALAHLHLHYETIPPHPDVKVVEKSASSAKSAGDYSFYAVEKMRFPAKDRKDTILYNSHITLTDIPAKAYDYVVNGKSAVEWIIDRYKVSVDTDSGIRNDCNDWACEHNAPRYILDLLLSIINVSCQTVDIVNTLPKVDFGTAAADSVPRTPDALPPLEDDYALAADPIKNDTLLD